MILVATQNIERILKTPEPNCFLIAYGDSSVDLEYRFWIKDPQKGTSNIKSEILLNVWDAFKKHNIEIPYPQRDIHIKREPDILKDKSFVSE